MGNRVHKTPGKLQTLEVPDTAEGKWDKNIEDWLSVFKTKSWALEIPFPTPHSQTEDLALTGTANTLTSLPVSHGPQQQLLYSSRDLLQSLPLAFELPSKLAAFQGTWEMDQTVFP